MKEVFSTVRSYRLAVDEHARSDGVKKTAMKGSNLLFGVGLLILIVSAIPVANANDKDSELLEGAQAGDVSRVERALDQGANIEAKNEMGATALMWAAVNGHDPVVSLLIQRGANVNSKTATGATALKGAAARGQLGVVRILLEAGADATAKDNQGITALDAARDAGQREVVAFLEHAAGKSAPVFSTLKYPSIEGTTWKWTFGDNTVQFLKGGNVRFCLFVEKQFDHESGGHWEQDGSSVKFDVGGFTLYEAVITGNQMKGTWRRSQGDTNKKFTTELIKVQ